MLACEQLKLDNCRLNVKYNVDKLFANVQRCHFDNVCVKDAWPSLFSLNLKQLILKKNASNNAQAVKLDLLKKLI